MCYFADDKTIKRDLNSGIVVAGSVTYVLIFKSKTDIIYALSLN